MTTETIKRVSSPNARRLITVDRTGWVEANLAVCLNSEELTSVGNRLTPAVLPNDCACSRVAVHSDRFKTVQLDVPIGQKYHPNGISQAIDLAL